MDNLLYVSITNAICLISLIGAVVTIAAFVNKKKVSPKGLAILLVFLTGCYLYIPMKLVYLGYSYQNPKYLNIASKISINPYERKLCHKYMAEIYSEDLFYRGIKDGNKAISHMERALKGKYANHRAEAELLTYWYSIKGDEKKVLELTEKLNIKKSIALVNIYIMKDDYKSSLNAFKDSKSIENYLKADLYKKTGDEEASKKAFAVAQKTYNSNMSKIKTRAKRLIYEEEREKYKSVDNYKAWIIAQRREYGF